MTEQDYVNRTRDGYDATAVEYVDYVRDELAAKPLSRAMLRGFADSVADAGGGPVADIGCGTGRVTAHLRGLGVNAYGIDLSPQMIAVAQREYPDLRFDVGNMIALDTADDALAGVVAWYSTIHISDEDLPKVFAEFRRVLTPGGYLLLAFQVGDEPRHLTEAFGQAVDLEFHRRQPGDVAALLTAAGFDARAQLVTAKDAGESTPQAYLLARKN